MKIRRLDTLVYWAALVAFMVSKREWLWDIMKPWPKWWKLLAMLCAGLFMSAVLLWSVGFDGWILGLFD